MVMRLRIEMIAGALAVLGATVSILMNVSTVFTSRSARDIECNLNATTHGLELGGAFEF